MALLYIKTEYLVESLFKKIRISFNNRQTIYCDNLQTIQLLIKYGLELSIRL